MYRNDRKGLWGGEVVTHLRRLIQTSHVIWTILFITCFDIPKYPHPSFWWFWLPRHWLAEYASSTITCHADKELYQCLLKFEPRTSSLSTNLCLTKISKCPWPDINEQPQESIVHGLPSWNQQSQSYMLYSQLPRLENTHTIKQYTSNFAENASTM